MIASRPYHNRACPSDSDCYNAWNQIASIARDHCLVIQAYGGVMILAMPEDQREEGIRDKVLRMHCAVETETEGSLSIGNVADLSRLLRKIEWISENEYVVVKL